MSITMYIKVYIATEQLSIYFSIPYSKSELTFLEKTTRPNPVRNTSQCNYSQRRIHRVTAPSFHRKKSIRKKSIQSFRFKRNNRS
jgi:hypothetical protein